jgi:ribosome maturation factor RimP
VNGTIDKQQLIALLEPPLRSMGYELVDLDLRLGGGGLLRVYIDAVGGITVDDCEDVSRQIGALLDVEDPLPGSYTLEVSSPGLDRRLRTVEHFERFMNEEVRIQLTRPQDGRRRFRGRLCGIDRDTVSIVVDGSTWRLRLDDIATANLVPQL